jgi:hypothetical protein
MCVANVVGNCICILVIVPLCLSEVPNGSPVCVPVKWVVVLVDIAAVRFESLNYDYVI